MVTDSLPAEMQAKRQHAGVWALSRPPPPGCTYTWSLGRPEQFGVPYTCYRSSLLALGRR